MSTQRITVPTLRDHKTRGHKLSMLTAYDAAQAQAVEESGAELILIGDSLGMVVQGHRSTLPVTVADIAYHTAAVARGASQPLLIADLPFLSYPDSTSALLAARTVMQAGAQMVKLEGADFTTEIVAYLSRRDVPVCAHLGLTPQSIHKLGGFKVQGRDGADADQLLADAIALEQAGAALLVLECVPDSLAARVSAALQIPTIGIGAGPHCDGQVLVFYDLLGLGKTRKPRFVKNFMAGRDSIVAALTAYVSAVRDSSFPGPEYSYGD